MTAEPALVYRVVHDSPDLDDVPAEVRPLIGRCLAKDAAQRPATADLLAELDGTDITAGWLPAPFSAEFSRRTVAPGAGEPGDRAANRSAWLSAAPAAPGEEPSTMTTARPGRGPAGPAARAVQARPASRAGAEGRRRRRRPALLLAAGILAASAGTVVGLKLATSNPAGNLAAGQRHSATPAAVTRPRTTAATQRPPSPASTTPPVAPSNVTATALNEYTVRVTWTDRGSGITGFNVTNGCGTDGCSGGALNVRTGVVTAAEVRTTPGAYVGISASGSAYVAAAGASEPPGGNPACTPENNYPADSGRFPASQLPCWSLIARIGDDPPFEVGTSVLIPATSGRLYLGVNCTSVSGDAGAWAVKIKVGGLP